MRMRSVRSLLFLCPFAALASAAAAQSLYGLVAETGTVAEFTGPPDGTCFYPDGPIVSTFPYVVPFVCPLPGPTPPGGLLGDIAVDMVADTIWVTDGFTLGEYTPGGAPISGFPVPPILVSALTGLGFDSALGILWITDGFSAAAIAPPPAPGCGGPAPAVVVPPFALPAITAGYTDIEWDSATGSLFLSTGSTFVANLMPGGALGPFGFFPAGLTCGFVGLLQGIAVDGAAPPGSGTHYVASAFGFAPYELPGGAPAPPTFYTTASCLVVPTTSLVGLAFAAHAIRYGAPSPPGGPTIAGLGQSLTPNPAFAVSVTGAPVPSVGLVAYSASFLCLPLPLGTALLFIGPPVFVLGSLAGPGGVLPAPLPPGLPVPGSLFLQAAFLDLSAMTFATTPGLGISFALP